MKSTLLLSIFVCTLLISSNSFKVTTNQQLSVSNQQEYAQLIKALLGYNSEDSSDQLKQFIKQNKLSLLNAAQEITILLAQGKVQEKQESQIQMTKQFIESLGLNTKNINILNTIGKSQPEINQIAVEQKTNFNKVHIIEGSKEELKAFEKLFKIHKNRLLQVIPANSTSYITKFFFSLMFIIVSFTSLGYIAYMENGKDTLLYAKFIADVGR